MSDYTIFVKRKLNELGADLAGAAEVSSLIGLKTIPPDLMQPFRSILSIAVQLPSSVFDQITDAPTPIYSSVYQTANRILDEIAFKTSIFLQQDGYRALPIPASQILDDKNWFGAVSHKAAALASGLGWQGKNLLLITPQFGSRVRLVTVLTDAPLTPDQPLKNRCGACTICQDFCPAHAIKGINTIDHYQTREEAVDLNRCVEKLRTDFAKRPEISALICGVCIKVCPFSSRKSKAQ